MRNSSRGCYKHFPSQTKGKNQTGVKKTRLWSGVSVVYGGVPVTTAVLGELSTGVETPEACVSNGKERKERGGHMNKTTGNE